MTIDYDFLDNADEQAKKTLKKQRGKTKLLKDLEANKKIEEKQQVRHSYTFSLHKDVKRRLDSYCSANFINKSMLVNDLVDEFLKDKDY